MYVCLIWSPLCVAEQVPPIEDLGANRTILKADGRTLKKTDGVMVKSKSGTWKRAIIQKTHGSHWPTAGHRDSVKVHYIGVADSLDEWIPRNSLRIGWRIRLTAFDEEADKDGRR